jgi:hypothetical protein
MRSFMAWAAALLCALCAEPVWAASAPDWLHALASAPVPAHEDKANAVQLLSETVLTVRSDGRMRRRVRVAYRILRPDGQALGKVVLGFDGQTRIVDLAGWCIPASGKDYVVRERDAIESALPGIENGELVSDVRAKIMLIPAALPGSVIGYEFEQEERPYFLGDEWDFQDVIPVHDARLSLVLPAGWTYKASWVRHATVEPIVAAGQVSWAVHDEAAVPVEERMPPWRGVAARMVLSISRPGAGAGPLDSWRELGRWYNDLVRDRRAVSPEIRDRVAALTQGAVGTLAKVRALANFVQADIRYVAIELGIGGQQPHPAAEVMQHHYGDCKDKVTLLSAMLAQIGVDSYYIVINTARGAVEADSSPTLYFNHVVMAIRLPADVEDPSLQAVVTHPRLGRLLYFDPTDSITPLGSLRGELQKNHAMLVSPDGGELTELPQLKPTANSIQRTAKLRLGAEGEIQGELVERRIGDPAAEERGRLRLSRGPSDRIKPYEVLLANAVPSYQILDSQVVDETANDRPLEWRLNFKAVQYAKTAGDLLLVRPRVVGGKSSGILNVREARRQPIEFTRPEADVDTFEIELPPNYTVDTLPPPVNAEYSFATYRSKTELVGRTLRYTRAFEVRELTVPAARAQELKTLYSVIATDENRTAVLVVGGH